MELHQKIAAARKKKGLTQEQLAELTNITVRTIQRLESGESVPRPYTLKAIAAALDTTFEVLTGSTPDGHPVASKDQHNTEDEKHFLQILCLSCFSYLVIPLVHFLVPAFLLKRSGLQNPGVIARGRSVVRLQIYWAVALCFLLLLTLAYNFIIAVYAQKSLLLNYLWPFLLMYLLNAALIAATLWRVKKDASGSRISS